MNLIKGLIFTCIFCSFLLLINMFYKETIKNNLPTPIPKNYKRVLDTPDFDLEIFKASNKIKVLHFFNPDCPCSKFNYKHIQSLYKKYKNEVEFVAFSTKNCDNPFEFLMLHDSLNFNAKKYGVYSTPQAVVVDKDGKIIYNGNYNKSRFCSNKNTNFVEQILENKLNNKKSKLVVSSPYGCSIFNN